MAKFWFKPKQYGWGAYPVTWQGWLLTFCFAFLCAAAFFIDVPMTETGLAGTFRDYLRYGLDIIILTALFLIVAIGKTEGEIKWRWGSKN
ncbi:MAG: hypothetical protein NTZ92_07305 [Candidatus Omnitrophica bacterium]|nr:hypothetical protein [Candidatus Omnitrophota bacterium]